MGYRRWLGALRGYFLSRLHRRPIRLGNFGPVVTFTFDDFPRSALLAGAAIIESAGGKATFYVATGLAGTHNALGEQFHLDDLGELQRRGHELANHGYSHLSARRTSHAVFLEDIRRGHNCIREYSPSSMHHNFAYPYGEATLSMKRMLGSLATSCRGTLGGLNGPEVDLNLLRANALYGDVEQFELARKLVLENEARRSWLIFYSHDVADRPSPFGCTPSLLQQVATFVGSRGAKIMTISEVVTALTPTAAHRKLFRVAANAAQPELIQRTYSQCMYYTW